MLRSAKSIFPSGSLIQSSLIFDNSILAVNRVPCQRFAGRRAGRRSPNTERRLTPALVPQTHAVSAPYTESAHRPSHYSSAFASSNIPIPHCHRFALRQTVPLWGAIRGFHVPLVEKRRGRCLRSTERRVGEHRPGPPSAIGDSLLLISQTPPSSTQPATIFRQIAASIEPSYFSSITFFEGTGESRLGYLVTDALS
jgi:hypothetical protein